MANVGTLTIIAQASTAALRAGLGRAAGLVGGFVSRAEGGLAGVGRALGQGALLAGGAAAAGLGLAVRQAVAFEDQMAGLGKATDLRGSDLDALKHELFGLSTELKGVPVENLIEIATSGAKLGIAREDLVGYTRGIAMLSTAMDDIPAGEIADSIGKINAVFSLDNIQGALQLGSAIDKVADSGVSASSDILNVVQRISGTAKVVGITADQSIALAGALLDTGTQAELGASAITRLLRSLMDAEGRAAMADTLGMDAERFAAMVRESPIQALATFLEKLRTLDAEAQKNAIAAVLGSEAGQASGEIMKLAQQTDALNLYLGLAAEQFATTTQIQDAYNITAGTTSANVVNLVNHLKILGDSIGSAIIPSLTALASIFSESLGTGAVGRLGGTTDAVFAVADAFATVIDVINAVGSVFHWMQTRVVVGFASIATVIDTLAGNLEMVINAIPGAVFGTVDLTTSTGAFAESLRQSAAAMAQESGPALGITGDDVRARVAESRRAQAEAAASAAASAAEAPAAAAAESAVQAIAPELQAALGLASAMAGGAIGAAGGNAIGGTLIEETAPTGGIARQGPTFAGAYELGTVEARRTLLMNMGRMGNDPATRMADDIQTQTGIQRQQLAVLRTLARGAAPVEMPA